MTKTYKKLLEEHREIGLNITLFKMSKNKDIDTDYIAEFNIGDKVVTLNNIDHSINHNVKGCIGSVTSIKHRYNDQASKERGVTPHYEYYVTYETEDNKIFKNRFYGHGIIHYYEFQNIIKNY